MVKNPVVRIAVLAVLSVAMLAGAVLLFGQYKKKAAHYTQLASDGAAELAQAQAAYDALDPTAADALLAEAETLKTENAALEESIAALETETADMEATLSSRQTEYEAACEENSYYKTIFDSLSEGLKKLEGYIDGAA